MSTAPLRIGTTSFILPDHILPNVEFLRGKVADVELLMFESAVSSLPTPKQIARLACIANESGITYTPHLPIDVDCAAATPEVRAHAVATIRSILALTAPLPVWAYVLHMPAHIACESENCPRERALWQARSTGALKSILATGLSSRRLCIENLEDYRFEVIASVVEDLDLSVCLDIGHLLLQGCDPMAFLERWRDRVRVVHLHGVHDGRDHRGLNSLDPRFLREFLSDLASDSVERVVTIEVFSLDKFQESMVVLEDIL